MEEKNNRKLNSKFSVLIIVIYVTIIGAFLLLLLILLGNFSSPIESMRVPSYFGKEKPILEAFEKQFETKDEFIYRAPIKGEFRSPVVFVDLDNDARDEALVFYSKKQDEKIIYIGIMQKIDKTWKLINNIRGNSGNIISAEIIKPDINSDNYLVFYWDLIGRENNGLLTLYMPEKDYKNTLTLKPIFKQNAAVYSKIAIDDKGNPGLVLCSLKYTDKNLESYAGVIKIENKNVKVLDENIEIDNSVNNYTKLSKLKKPDGEYIFLDTIKENTSSLTEVLFWNYKEQKLTSLFTKPQSFTNFRTLRPVKIECKDIDGDEIIEIPTYRSDYYKGYKKSLKYGEKFVPVIEWSTLDKFNLKEKSLSFVNQDDGYLFKIDNDNKMVGIRNERFSKTEFWTTKNGEKSKKLFEIYSVDYSKYSENTNNYSEYFVYGTVGNKMIMYKITDDGAKAYINEEYIKSNMESLV